jgi:hypothetical protein
VATGQSGRVTLNEEGLLRVEEADAMGWRDTTFCRRLAEGEPAVSIVVSAEALRQAAAGQEGFVRLRFYGDGQPLELASAGKYALVMPTLGAPEGRFWGPGHGASDD